MKQRIRKIIRPQFEIEYIGIKGFLSALLAICKVGIKRVRLNYVVKSWANGNAGTVKVVTHYVIPKYTFKNGGAGNDKRRIKRSAAE